MKASRTSEERDIVYSESLLKEKGIKGAKRAVYPTIFSAVEEKSKSMIGACRHGRKRRPKEMTLPHPGSLVGPSHGPAPASLVLGQEGHGTQGFLPPQLSPLLKVTPERWLKRSSLFAKLNHGVIVNKTNNQGFLLLGPWRSPGRCDALPGLPRLSFAAKSGRSCCEEAEGWRFPQEQTSLASPNTTARVVKAQQVWL